MKRKTAPWKGTEKDRKYAARIQRIQATAWKHPYETREGDVCVHCGQIGSYIHTDPAQR